MLWLKRLLYRACVWCRPQRAKTVKYAFSYGLVGIMVATVAAVALTDNDSYIRMEADRSAVKAGETFNIKIYAFSHVPVNTVNIKLTFPEDRVSIEAIDTGSSVISIWTEEPFVDGNSITFSGGTFRKGFLGEHLIASVRVRAITSGLAEFNTSDITFLAGDGSGTEVTTRESGEESIALNVSNDGQAGSESEGTSESKPGSIQATVAVSITTDIDKDGEVTMDDIQAFIAAWRNEQVAYDFNQDSKMTFTDFAILLADFFFGR